jgi:hypothetical protein
VESRPEGRAARLLAETVVAPGNAWEAVAVDLDPARAHATELVFSVACEPAAPGVTLARAARWRVPVVRRRDPAGQTNVVLVTVDTLRADHLGAYGYARPTSPRIDGFPQGARFRFETAERHLAALTSSTRGARERAGVIWNGCARAAS